MCPARTSGHGPSRTLPARAPESLGRTAPVAWIRHMAGRPPTTTIRKKKADSQFRWLPLAELRERSSIKWRAFEPDVLPLWVAEMDCAPAPAVVGALTDALHRGDTGYPAGTAYPEALADFAAQRWGWEGVDVGRSRLVPDVMTGIVELLRLVTGPGD